MCLGFVLTACPKPLLEDLEQLEKSLSGSFSSIEQSQRDSTYLDIRLEVVPIWQDRKDGPWLYVEQAAGESLDKPYRQRVYHLSKNDSFLVSSIYSIPDPLRFVMKWKSADPLSELTPDSLMHREGCDVFLIRIGKEDFEGSTSPKSCSSALRGASYATSEVKIDRWTMWSWDRGFNLGDDQVWGATEGPYRFDRVADPE